VLLIEFFTALFYRIIYDCKLRFSNITLDSALSSIIEFIGRITELCCDIEECPKPFCKKTIIIITITLENKLHNHVINHVFLS